MSVRAITWVWDESQADGTDRLVMLALADNANDQGVCWPSIAEIARKAHISTRTAQRSIKSLEAQGELVASRPKGGHTSTRYRLNIAPAARSGVTESQVSNSHPGNLTRQNVTSLKVANSDILPDRGDTGVTQTVSQEQTHKNLPSQVPADKPQRGTRLPNDWTPDAGLITWQRAQGIPDEFARTETEAFRDWAAGAPGQRGVKLDWSGTWRNWMRKSWREHGQPRPPRDFKAEARETATAERRRNPFAAGL